MQRACSRWWLRRVSLHCGHPKRRLGRRVALAHRGRHAHALQVDLAAAQADREERARQAVAAERTRIARELHDVIAHNLSVAIIQLTAALPDLHEDDDATTRVRAAEAACRQALEEMRRLLGVLRATTSEPAAVTRTRPRLRRRARRRRREPAGLAVELVDRGNADAAAGRASISPPTASSRRRSRTRSSTATATPASSLRYRRDDDRDRSRQRAARRRRTDDRRQRPRPDRHARARRAVRRKPRRRPATERRLPRRRPTAARTGHANDPRPARRRPDARPRRLPRRSSTASPTSTSSAKPATATKQSTRHASSRPRRRADGHPHAATSTASRRPARCSPSRDPPANPRPHHLRPRRVRLRRAQEPAPAASCSKTSAPASSPTPSAPSPPANALLSPAITRRLIEQHVRTRPPPGTLAARRSRRLTERELDVLRLLARGLSNTEIAEQPLPRHQHRQDPRQPHPHQTRPPRPRPSRRLRLRNRPHPTRREQPRPGRRRAHSRVGRSWTSGPPANSARGSQQAQDARDPIRAAASNPNAWSRLLRIHTLLSPRLHPRCRRRRASWAAHDVEEAEGQGSRERRRSAVYAVKRAADIYDAVERWADFRTTDLERLAHHPDPELCAMLGDVRDEVISEIARRRNARQSATALDGTVSLGGS